MKWKIIFALGIVILVVSLVVVRPELNEGVVTTRYKAIDVLFFGGLEDLIEITYKDDNMTIEFKENEVVIGEATLKSHTTYDEIKKVTTGKNRTVIWYEFSDFKDIQLDALKGVEFIDMREYIVNESKKINEFEEPEIIPNPNYLVQVEKNYSFIFLKDEKWLLYDSFDIPKESIIIGVQTDLFWGEFIDVRFNIFDNKLDRHAVVLGVSAGFVTVAPVDDPASGTNVNADNRVRCTKDTAPSDGIVTEIGLWIDVATQAATIGFGLYSDDGGEPGDLLGSDTVAKGTTAGWKKVTGLDIEIENTVSYWIAWSMTDTATTTKSDIASGGTERYDFGVTSLASSWDTEGDISSTSLSAIYAVVGEATPEDTCTCPVSGNWLIQCSDNCSIQACNMKTNNVLLNGTGKVLGLRNVTNATRIRIQEGCTAGW